MNSIALLLTEKIIQKNIIKPEDKEIYKRGIELILSDIINVFLVLSLGIITKTFLLSCIYFVVFCSVRKFSGGFHAKTYGMCRTVTVGVYAAVIAAASFIKTHTGIWIAVIDIFSVITVILLAPVRHPNKELNSTEVRANKFLAVAAVVLFSAASIILNLFNRTEGLVISLVLLAVAILMYVGLAINKKQ